MPIREELWEFNIEATVSTGGPSRGKGTLLVPAGHEEILSKGGYIVTSGFHDE